MCFEFLFEVGIVYFLAHWNEHSIFQRIFGSCLFPIMMAVEIYIWSILRTIAKRKQSELMTKLPQRESFAGYIPLENSIVDVSKTSPATSLQSPHGKDKTENLKICIVENRLRMGKFGQFASWK